MWDAETILEKLNTDQRWLERGVLAIDRRQTDDEKADLQTKYSNGRGWNGSDARRGSRMASYIRRCRRPDGERLTGDHIDKARRMMQKYAGQLARIVAEKEPVAA